MVVTNRLLLGSLCCVLYAVCARSPMEEENQMPSSFWQQFRENVRVTFTYYTPIPLFYASFLFAKNFDGHGHLLVQSNRYMYLGKKIAYATQTMFSQSYRLPLYSERYRQATRDTIIMCIRCMENDLYSRRLMLEALYTVAKDQQDTYCHDTFITTKHDNVR
jgi:hypothetical protein